MKYHLTIVKTQKVLLGHCVEKRSGMALFHVAACMCLGTRNGRRDLTCGSSVSIVLNFPVLIHRSTPTKMRATSACIQSMRLCDTVYFDNRPCIVHNAVSLRMFQSSSRTAVDSDTRPCVSKKCARSFFVDNQPKKPSQ